MTWSAPVVRHLWESETSTALYIPRAALFCRWSAPFLVCCYLISGSSNKSDSLTLMFYTRRLGAGEHQAKCESESQSSLSGAIKGLTMESESGNCTAGVPLTFSTLLVFIVSPDSPGNLNVLFYILLTLNDTVSVLYNSYGAISLLYVYSSMCLCELCCERMWVSMLCTSYEVYFNLITCL